MEQSRIGMAVWDHSGLRIRRIVRAAAIAGAVGAVLFAGSARVEGFCGLSLRPRVGSLDASSLCALPQPQIRSPRWKQRNPDVPLDPYLAAKEEKNLDAPLPWKRSQCEIMVDSMSVIKYFWKEIRKEREDLVLEHDLFAYWPAKLVYAVQSLTGLYGTDRPPSPWRPIVAVFDQPDPKKVASGLKVRKWYNLRKQGPRFANGMTLAWAQTYVDQSAEERYRCDREILYMLEILTRDFDRRQVLITNDRTLQANARRFCTVRGPQWLRKEIWTVGGRPGKEGIETLLGGRAGVGRSVSSLPTSIRNAFITQ